MPPRGRSLEDRRRGRGWRRGRPGPRGCDAGRCGLGWSCSVTLNAGPPCSLHHGTPGRGEQASGILPGSSGRSDHVAGSDPLVVLRRVEVTERDHGLLEASGPRGGPSWRSSPRCRSRCAAPAPSPASASGRTMRLDALPVGLDADDAVLAEGVGRRRPAGRSIAGGCGGITGLNTLSSKLPWRAGEGDGRVVAHAPARRPSSPPRTGWGSPCPA